MIIEFFLVGLAAAALLMFLGWSAKEKGSNHGNHFLIGGALILIIIGIFAAIDTQGLEVQTYGSCVNASSDIYGYSNITGYNESGGLTNLTVRTASASIYSYGPCYHETTGFNLSQMIAVVLVLIGVGTMIGVVGWSKTEDLYTE